MENNSENNKFTNKKSENEVTTLANTSVKGIGVTQGVVRNYTLFDIIQSEEVKEMYCESYILLFNYFQGQSGPEIALICHKSDMIKNLKYTGSSFYMKANHIWREVSIYEVIDFIYIIMVNFLKKLIEFLKVRFNSGYKLCTASQVYRLFEHKKILSTAIVVLKPEIYDHSFLNKLDNNISVIPFTNGMFDLDTCLFREYKEDDYVSETVGYGCEITTFDRAEKMFMNLFNTNEEYAYAAFWIGSFLDNRIYNDKLFWLIGDGRNGKSVLLNVLADVMGNLHHALPSNYFSKESSNFNKANVELIKISKTKITTLAEPSRQVVLSSVVKKTCGNDRSAARSLYSNQMQNFKLRSKFILCANKMPDIDFNDQPVMNRLVVLNFQTRFVERPIKSYEKPIEKGFSDMIGSVSFRNEFFSLMVEYYKKYLLLGNKLPPTVPESSLILTKGMVIGCVDFRTFISGKLVYNANRRILKFNEVVKAYCYKNGQVVPASMSKEYVNYLTDFKNEYLRMKIQYDQKKNDNMRYKRIRDDGAVLWGFPNVDFSINDESNEDE